MERNGYVPVALVTTGTDLKIFLSEATLRTIFLSMVRESFCFANIQQIFTHTTYKYATYLMNIGMMMMMPV